MDSKLNFRFHLNVLLESNRESNNPATTQEILSVLLDYCSFLVWQLDRSVKTIRLTSSDSFKPVSSMLVKSYLNIQEVLQFVESCPKDSFSLENLLNDLNKTKEN